MTPSKFNFTNSNRFWLLTWTTYGTWLPGDQRGFVSPVSNRTTREPILHNQSGTEYDKNKSTRQKVARLRMKSSPVYLNQNQAIELLAQFHETSKFRSWLLLAAAVMSNHIHLVVETVADPNPSALLQAYKSYASRRLNRVFGKNENSRWWTEHGSKRKLSSETSVIAAGHYVLQQDNPLVVWGDGRLEE